VYWENRPFYGFGMGAASYTQHQRFNRPRTTHDYYDWLEGYGETGGKLTCEVLGEGDRWLDRLMMGLRLVEGIDLDHLSQEFGSQRVADLKKTLDPYVQKGWVALQEAPIARVRFTDPEGFLFSNVVLVKLFEAFGDPE
jgi:oxygen-independent coproporphyrinogen-3 oxidase